MKDESVLLARMVDSAEKILRATQGKSEQEFGDVETTPAAVVLWLTQIGEIAKRLREDTKSRYALPWKDIIGFRDMAVHEYFELSLADVYLTATKDIPELVRVLKGGA